MNRHMRTVSLQLLWNSVDYFVVLGIVNCSYLLRKSQISVVCGRSDGPRKSPAWLSWDRSWDDLLQPISIFIITVIRIAAYNHSVSSSSLDSLFSSFQQDTECLVCANLIHGLFQLPFCYRRRRICEKLKVLRQVKSDWMP